MSKNSNNVIFTRHEAIADAHARLRCSGLNITPRQKSVTFAQINNIGTKVFDQAKHHSEPEKFYVEELRRIQREGTVEEFTAANMLLEAVLKLIYDKYHQLKEILGE